MLCILRDRFPDRRVIIRPVKVQGEGAASEIAQGIAELGQSGMVEVMIVGRGGGSLEDLWALDRKSTRLNSSHGYISYAVFCLKKKNMTAADLHGDGKPEIIV